MHRAVTALLGPTNTGKTYLAIERMLTHPTGMIGFPLRLLARENYDRVAALRGPEAVALVTGEERIVPPRPSYWMCTVEAMPLDLKVDFLAVDEVQLAADRERGHVFTDRIEHARGRLETWLLGAETVRPLLHKLLPDAAFTTRPRLSTLSASEPKRLGKLPPRTAVIVFSVRELYEVAARLRREQGGAALVFGALSPRTRNAQVGLYQAGEVDLLVATDAIGMGLNLDIDHVVFTGLTKFDGVGPRPLTPAEVGQVAGRAGRHVRDGHFAPTTELGPFDPRLVDAVEKHRFAPLTHLYWRTDALDFFSPLALLGSLDRPPPQPFLLRMRHAEDQAALAALTRDADVMALARDPDSVRLLWEVCQVPDFQGIVTEGHTRLLSRVFRFLREPAGRIPEDFLASHVKDIDRADGDVETLLGRIAAIRTWTYISQRRSWVPDARFWQERTRAVEDRLSDALHERLTQEFVDRPGTVIARHDPSELVTSVGGDGEVLVQGLRAGVLDGFRFRPDREVRESSKALLAAANRALSGLVRERVETLEREEDAVVRPRARGRGPVAGRRGGAARGRREPAAAAGGRRRERPPRPAPAGARAAAPRRLARVAPAGDAPPALRPPRGRSPRPRPRARLRPRRGPRCRLPSLRRAAGRGPDAGRSEGPGAPGGHGRPPLALPPRAAAAGGRAPAGTPLRRTAGAPGRERPRRRAVRPPRPAPARRLLPGLRLPARRPARRPARPAGARRRRRLAPLPRGAVRPPAGPRADPRLPPRRACRRS